MSWCFHSISFEKRILCRYPSMPNHSSHFQKQWFSPSVSYAWIHMIVVLISISLETWSFESDQKVCPLSTKVFIIIMLFQIQFYKEGSVVANKNSPLNPIEYNFIFLLPGNICTISLFLNLTLSDFSLSLSSPQYLKVSREESHTRFFSASTELLYGPVKNSSSNLSKRNLRWE